MIEIVLFASTFQRYNVSTSLADSERLFAALSPPDRGHRHGGEEGGHRKRHRPSDGPGNGELNDPVICLHPDQTIGAWPDDSARLFQRRPQLQQCMAGPL